MDLEIGSDETHLEDRKTTHATDADADADIDTDVADEPRKNSFSAPEKLFSGPKSFGHFNDDRNCLGSSDSPSFFFSRKKLELIYLATKFVFPCFFPLGEKPFLSYFCIFQELKAKAVVIHRIKARQDPKHFLVI